MDGSDWLRDALRGEAADINMSPGLPSAVQRSIRRRRAGAVLAALGIVAAAAIGVTAISDEIVADSDRSNGVAGEGELRAGVMNGIQTTNPRVVGRGRDFRVRWELVVSDSPNGPCLELQIDRQPLVCDLLGEDFVPGFAVYPGSTEDPERSYVIGTIPDASGGVLISLRGGGQWAGLIFEGPRGDDRTYFVRIFPSAAVSGLIQLEEGGRAVEFEVRPTDNGGIASAGIARDDTLPGFEGLPGETNVIWTEPVGDSFTGEPYDVVLRSDAQTICLHIEEALGCTYRAELGDEVRLTNETAVGEGVVIAGLVGPDVEAVVIESGKKDRYPQQLLTVRQSGLEHRYFVMETSAPFEGELVVTLRDGTIRRQPLEVI